MAELEKLAISDAESAYKAIVDAILKFPNFPAKFEPSNANIRWNMTGGPNSIGLFPLQGAVYIKKYISGSYVAQLPFEIIYKIANCNTNKAMIAAQDMLTELGTWLEACTISAKDSDLTFDNIDRTSPVFVASQDDKFTELALNMQLKYSQKK